MPATPFEYRFRFLIHALIFVVGFGLIPLLDGFTPGILQALGITNRTTWLVLSSMLSRQHLLNFSTAVTVVLLVAIVFLALAAWLRVWGAAYVGTHIVKSPTMHAEGAHGRAMLADGPYRRTRNPLYLGVLLHTIGLAILMPPLGAVIAIALVWIFEVRLALAEEPFLTAQFGQPYLDYKAAVPRFLPAPTPVWPAAGDKPHWLQAILGEIYFLGALGTVAALGWDFNTPPLERGILISLGVSIVIRGLMPKPKPAQD